MSPDRRSKIRAQCRTCPGVDSVFTQLRMQRRREVQRAGTIGYCQRVGSSFELIERKAVETTPVRCFACVQKVNSWAPIRVMAEALVTGLSLGYCCRNDSIPMMRRAMFPPMMNQRDKEKRSFNRLEDSTANFAFSRCLLIARRDVTIFSIPVEFQLRKHFRSPCMR